MATGLVTAGYRASDQHGEGSSDSGLQGVSMVTGLVTVVIGSQHPPKKPGLQTVAMIRMKSTWKRFTTTKTKSFLPLSVIFEN